MKKVILPVAVFFLFLAEILRIYFIMPFPGSQYDNTIALAYFLHRTIFWIRIILLLIIFWQLILLFKKRKWWRAGFTILFLLIFIPVWYFFNFKLNADKMFYQPDDKIFTSSNENRVGQGKLILGVTINGESKAYPIEIIGYHHQVRDVVGNKPVMVTYCTVCRTGRIYDPMLNGKLETFRLVGMDHFNAMFEDGSTKSWWRQATGESIAGPLKGEQLSEIFSEQMTLVSWLEKHPGSKILQPDKKFLKEYEQLVGFDEGTIDSDLEERNFNSWQLKSWVIGIEINGREKAYDWNDVLKLRVINDNIGKDAILIVLENNDQNFQAYNRNLEGQIFEFKFIDGNTISDIQTASIWNLDGICIDGALKGKQLIPIQAYQEFYHSWKEFHPNTEEFSSRQRQ